jgi:hypothetical protein
VPSTISPRSETSYMPHRLRRLTAWSLCGCALGFAGLAGGCGTGAANAVAQTGATAKATVATAENTAIQVVQSTVRQVLNIPQLVYDIANGTATSNGNQGWGQPQMIVVTDSDYVFIYPTPEAERIKNRGIPRMVVIRRDDQTDPTRRL